MIPAGLPMRRADGAIMYRAVDGDVFTGDEPYHRWIDAVRHAQVVQEFRRQGLWDEAADYKQSWLEYRHGPGWTLVIEGACEDGIPYPDGYFEQGEIRAPEYVPAPDDWQAGLFRREFDEAWLMLPRTPRMPWCPEWLPRVQALLREDKTRFPSSRLPNGDVLVGAYVDLNGRWMVSTWPFKTDHPYAAELSVRYPDIPDKLLQPWRFNNVMKRLQATDALAIFRETDAWDAAWHRYAVNLLPIWPLLSEPSVLRLIQGRLWLDVTAELRSREGK